MIDKTTSLEDAVSWISDGAVVMVGGFGVPGTPFILLDELLRQGRKGLTLIKNEANEAGMGVDHLLMAGVVDKIIVSHTGLNPNAVRLMNEGKLQVEICPQGILAERIRAGGAGLAAIVTDIGVDTLLAENKQIVEMEGRRLLLEPALKADVALIHAHRTDHFGNAVYDAGAMNFNPLMAMAADRVIVETEEVVPLGDIDPNIVHTPGPFVDHVVAIPELTEAYGVVRR